MSQQPFRPKTSFPKTPQSSTKYSHLSFSKQSISLADRGPSFTLINSKFTRRKFKEDFGLDANTETAYNTRNGVLNSSMKKKRPGGNGYFSILRQKRQIAEVMGQETELDRRIRDMKLDLIEGRKLLPEQSFSTASGDNRPSTFITTIKGEKSDHSRLSKSFSVSSIRPKTESSPAKRIIPASFSFAAIRCICDPDLPCICGKRELSVSPSIVGKEHTEKIEGILGSCEVVSKEAAVISVEMTKDLKAVKKRLKVCHRHTKTIMMGIQRAHYFSIRRKFQLATRRQEKFQNNAQICIPADIEEAAESDPSMFITDSAATRDGYSG